MRASRSCILSIELAALFGRLSRWGPYNYRPSTFGTPSGPAYPYSGLDEMVENGPISIDKACNQILTW